MAGSSTSTSSQEREREKSVGSIFTIISTISIRIAPKVLLRRVLGYYETF